MTNTEAKDALWNLVKDAVRYRELRKHRNHGNPQPGVPFAMGWDIDESEELTGNTFYIREGQLDSEMDSVIFGDRGDAPHPIDSILDPILAALGQSSE